MALVNLSIFQTDCCVRKPSRFCAEELLSYTKTELELLVAKQENTNVPGLWAAKLSSLFSKVLNFGIRTLQKMNEAKLRRLYHDLKQ